MKYQKREWKNEKEMDRHWKMIPINSYTYLLTLRIQPYPLLGSLFPVRLVEAGSNFVCEQKREIAREGDGGKEQGKKKDSWKKGDNTKQKGNPEK